jgi:hypothetical protein
MTTLVVDRTDGWRTPYSNVENVRVEHDHLVFDREAADLGRYETRLDCDEIKQWLLVELRSGLERG